MKFQWSCPALLHFPFPTKRGDGRGRRWRALQPLVLLPLMRALRWKRLLSMEVAAAVISTRVLSHRREKPRMEFGQGAEQRHGSFAH
jgi:hypothetical protein